MTDSTLRVASGRPARFILNDAKNVLKKTGTVELHGLGKAITNSFKVAEMLQTMDYAIPSKIQTSLVYLEGARTLVPKTIITLIKSPNFDTVWKEFEQSRKPVDLLQSES